MSSFLKDIPGYIKFIALIDSQNNPIIFFNLNEGMNEFDYETGVFSSLDLCDKFRMREDEMLGSSKKEEYQGLLIPFYDFEEDLGAYGYIGNNGLKIIVIKKLEKEDSPSDKKIEAICREIYVKFIELTLNPFYNKAEFGMKDSKQKNKFVDEIFNMLGKNQII